MVDRPSLRVINIRKHSAAQVVPTIARVFPLKWAESVQSTGKIDKNLTFPAT